MGQHTGKNIEHHCIAGYEKLIRANRMMRNVDLTLVQYSLIPDVHESKIHPPTISIVFIKPSLENHQSYNKNI
jgi:hypothetical protein